MLFSVFFGCSERLLVTLNIFTQKSNAKWGNEIWYENSVVFTKSNHLSESFRKKYVKLINIKIIVYAPKHILKSILPVFVFGQ